MKPNLPGFNSTSGHSSHPIRALPLTVRKTRPVETTLARLPLVP